MLSGSLFSLVPTLPLALHSPRFLPTLSFSLSGYISVIPVPGRLGGHLCVGSSFHVALVHGRALVQEFLFFCSHTELMYVRGGILEVYL